MWERESSLPAERQGEKGRIQGGKVRIHSWYRKKRVLAQLKERKRGVILALVRQGGRVQPKEGAW